jgi:NADPH-dependent ferric siderophore reductase
VIIDAHRGRQPKVGAKRDVELLVRASFGSKNSSDPDEKARHVSKCEALCEKAQRMLEIADATASPTMVRILRLLVSLEKSKSVGVKDMDKVRKCHEHANVSWLPTCVMRCALIRLHPGVHSTL